VRKLVPLSAQARHTAVHGSHLIKKLSRDKTMTIPARMNFNGFSDGHLEANG
jgi:hypothetical protein